MPRIVVKLYAEPGLEVEIVSEEVTMNTTITAAKDAIKAFAKGVELENRLYKVKIVD